MSRKSIAALNRIDIAGCLTTFLFVQYNNALPSAAQVVYLNKRQTLILILVSYYLFNQQTKLH